MPQVRGGLWLLPYDTLATTIPLDACCLACILLDVDPEVTARRRRIWRAGL